MHPQVTVLLCIIFCSVSGSSLFNPNVDFCEQMGCRCRYSPNTKVTGGFELKSQHSSVRLLIDKCHQSSVTLDSLQTVFVNSPMRCIVECHNAPRCEAVEFSLEKNTPVCRLLTGHSEFRTTIPSVDSLYISWFECKERVNEDIDWCTSNYHGSVTQYFDGPSMSCNVAMRLTYQTLVRAFDCACDDGFVRMVHDAMQCVPVEACSRNGVDLSSAVQAECDERSYYVRAGTVQKELLCDGTFQEVKGPGCACYLVFNKDRQPIITLRDSNSNLDQMLSNMSSATEEKTPLLHDRIRLTSTDGSQGSRGTNKSKSDSDSKKREKKNQVPLRKLFRYATFQDIVYIIIGSVFSVIHGAGWPFMSIIFGNMTTVFLRAQNSMFDPTSDTHNNNTYQEVYHAPSFRVTAVDGDQHFIDITRKNFLDLMTSFSLDYVYVAIAMLVTSYGQIACWQTACERQVYKLRKAFFHAILRQEIAWFDTFESGELTSKLGDDLERVREGLGDKFSLSIQFISAFVAGFVIGFVYSWQLTLVMMSLTPLLAACGAFIAYEREQLRGRQMDFPSGKVHFSLRFAGCLGIITVMKATLLSSSTQREQEKYGRAGAVAEEVLGCIRTVIAFGGQRKEVARYKTELEAGKEIGIRKYFYMGMGLFFMFLVMFGTYALAFWYGSVLIMNDPNFDKGIVFTVFFAVMSGSFSLGNAAPHLSAVAAARGSAWFIFQVIDNTSKIDSASLMGDRLDSVRGRLEFSRVRFAYPTRTEVQVLRGLSVKIEPGEKIAVVGSSGCGKSTIVNLLLRFYDPQRGRIYLDGYEISNLNVRYLRANVGVVSQEPVLFSGTIRENIEYGVTPGTPVDIFSAAQKANAHGFICKLPQGYETLVGERGAQLSGGQKQRIAIARALVGDPAVLLLDEATSALDTESEAIVQDALDKAQEGRTCLIIAHRLSTIRNADRIIVLRDGAVVECGTHQQLMAKSSVYAELVNAQMTDDTLTAKTTDSSAEAESEPSTIHSAPTSSRRRRYTKRSRNTQFGRYPGRVGGGDSLITSGSGTDTSSGRALLAKRGDRLLEESEHVNDIESETSSNVSWLTIFRENKEGWCNAFLGLIGSIIQGSVMPVFALFYGQMFAVYSREGDSLRSGAVFWSMMFIVLGAVQGIGYWMAIFGDEGCHLVPLLSTVAYSGSWKIMMLCTVNGMNGSLSGDRDLTYVMYPFKTS